MSSYAAVMKWRPSRDSKVPCAKTVLMFMKNPEKSTRFHPEKMRQLLSLVRANFRSEDLNEKAMDAFLKRQQVIDIFVSPKSKIDSATTCNAIEHDFPKRESATEELTQMQADIFKSIRKHPGRKVSAHCTPKMLNPGNDSSNRHTTSPPCLTYIFRPGKDFNRFIFGNG
jgi:hypothetical protein